MMVGERRSRGTDRYPVEVAFRTNFFIEESSNGRLVVTGPLKGRNMS